MAHSSAPFRAACVQMRSGIDRAVNLRSAVDLIMEAAKAGAQLITTPEMTNVIDRNPARMLQDLPAEDAAVEIATFSALAKRHHVWLLIGSMAIRTGQRRAANRSFLFAPDGKIVARYDKLHRFDVDLPNGESWRESNLYDAGSTACLVETPLAKIGLTICYDLRFPHLFRRLAQAGAELFCVPSAFTRQTGEAHWKTLLSARAIENGAFVIAPAQGGRHEDGRETYGHSLIIGPWGEILAMAAGDEPGVIFADIEPASAHEARQKIPNLALEQDFKTSIVRS